MPLPTPLPTVAELVAHAIVHTDFMIEVEPTDTIHAANRAATIATNQVCEAWEERHDQPVGATVPDNIRHTVAAALILHADAMHRAAEDEAKDVLEFGMACGDLDRNGRPIGYDTYRSA